MGIWGELSGRATCVPSRKPWVSSADDCKRCGGIERVKTELRVKTRQELYMLSTKGSILFLDTWWRSLPSPLLLWLVRNAQDFPARSDEMLYDA